MAEQDALPCLLCDRALPRDPVRRCLTDCAHEFCLSCLCRQLAARKNRCPACGAPVKTVHQLQPSPAPGASASVPAPAPASVRFCNATYVLNVSIWDVQDPARVLAGLFNLEHARLIHRGKLLKKGDVWPGTLVQLFGTIKGGAGVAAGGGNTLSASLNAGTSWLSSLWTTRARQILCCPCSVLYDFVRSLFGGVEDHARGQRGYARVATDADVEGGANARFHEPGRVAAPPSIDSL